VTWDLQVTGQMAKAEKDPGMSYSILIAAEAASEAFPLIDIKRAAKILDRCVRTVRRWEAEGTMPPRIKHGRRKMYRRDAVDALAAQLHANVD
jgi:hypothetical protein